MPRREEKKAESRRRILDAAREVFFRDGFMAANLDEVAEKAGVAKGTLYRYFPNRHALHLAYVKRESRRILERVRAETAGLDDPHERLVEFLLASLRHVRGNPGTPPISGGFMSQAAWDHFVLEWQQTESENASVFAAVVHTPSETTVALVDLPSVVRVRDIEHYRRDAFDPNFPGELYVRGHRVPDGFGIKRNVHDCDSGGA